MNTILLSPTDVLFFRDGRPMGGASSGHGAAWPMPTVTDAALHAALHRSTLQGHEHRQTRRVSPGQREYRESRERSYGSLSHAGPFPVDKDGNWYFPRPLDLQERSTKPAVLPVGGHPWRNYSSLPKPLVHSLGSRLPPSKDSPPSWLRADAYAAYLEDRELDADESSVVWLRDATFCSTEFTWGIGIDPETGTQDKKRFYSAQYLRLHEDWCLGILARTAEKRGGNANDREDLIQELLSESEQGGSILVGGQQRVCTAKLVRPEELPLPKGRLRDFPRLEQVGGGATYAVKWTLLTPAIFPALSEAGRISGEKHPGGWLPNWVNPETGDVELLNGPGKAKADRLGLKPGSRIRAKLASALIGKPQVITGWALPNEKADRVEGGAKPTLLAVPAGSVYYFAAESEQAAKELAEALNWHGKDETPSVIQNRRSTLLGEKGFGLGVCSRWEYLPTSDKS